MKNQKKYKLLKIMLIVVGSLAFLLAIYFLPPVHQRLSWRVDNIRADIFYFFNRPEENTFSPGQQAQMAAIVQQTQTAMAIAATPTSTPTEAATAIVSPTPSPTASPTPSPTPIPQAVLLEGVVWEGQSHNNCGPANLSMALSYWGWDGDQSVTRAWLRPNDRDRNVMPYEMLEYVQAETNLTGVIRYGGDIDTIKKFVAAGLPVVIEKGYVEEVPQGGWMGHYGLITAYDDTKNEFLIQDSFTFADYVYSYSRVEKHWQAFNYVYLVIYPPDRQEDVNAILGEHVDETYNLQFAAQKALAETETQSGRELFFAWYNYGTSLMYLNDYLGSAQAYDRAYGVLQDEFDGYNPVWRVTWYQTGPYFAYFYSGRYQDVIDLADLTLSYSFEPAIEETWVWRGRAKAALGDTAGAIADFREALKWHPGWWVAETELRNLGVTP